MTIPTAKDMANNLNFLGNVLLEQKLITNQSISSISKAASALKGKRESKDWDYIVSKSDYIEFTPTDHECNETVVPRMYTSVKINDNADQPFKELNVVIEIYSLSGNPLKRWHVDYANDGQNGSCFHLQEGGHWPGREDRENESSLKVPRWPIPPMDIVLVSELIIANFYPDEWEVLCRNQNWLFLIKDAQKFCYSFYQQKLNACSHTSYLRETWASEWN